MRKKFIVAALAFVTLAGVAFADIYSDAEQSTSKFETEVKDLKSLTVAETKTLVEAICQAEEAERKAIGQEASNRVKAKVTSKYDDLEKLRDESDKLIDKVLADATQSSNHAKAKSLKEDVSKRWETVTKMTKSLRGANHPVVSWMLDKGNEEHQSRQRSSSCDVSEFTVSSGRIDCLKISGSNCKVIELKPKNNKAIAIGKDQAQRYVEDLNKLGPDFKKLVEKDAAFKQCKEFKPQVDCYTLCPEIDGDGIFQSTSVSWSEGC